MRTIIKGIIAGLVALFVEFITLHWRASDAASFAGGILIGIVASVALVAIKAPSRKPKPVLSAARSGQSTSGFTLIELLAVIVIVALISAIGYPALKAMQGAALQTGARQFSNTLILARQQAINQRTPVRVTLAVDYLSLTNAVGPASASNYVCRAYGVYKASNDVNGVVVAWWPVQDWRPLPAGVVFSEQNAKYYQLGNSPVLPPAGSSLRILGEASSSNTAWQAFESAALPMPIVRNGATAAYCTTALAYIEFSPTGAVKPLPSGGTVAGVRLMSGAVTDPLTRTLVINQTNTWACVEYDSLVGRVRTRYPEDYQ